MRLEGHYLHSYGCKIKCIDRCEEYCNPFNMPCPNRWKPVTKHGHSIPNKVFIILFKYRKSSLLQSRLRPTIFLVKKVSLVPWTEKLGLGDYILEALLFFPGKIILDKKKLISYSVTVLPLIFLGTISWSRPQNNKIKFPEPLKNAGLGWFPISSIVSSGLVNFTSCVFE